MKKSRSKPQLAIADKDGRLSLWCDAEGYVEAGKLKENETEEDIGWERIWVINGLWGGWTKDGMVKYRINAWGRKISGDFDGNIVWRGTVPEKCFGDYVYEDAQGYNAAMEWIKIKLT